MDANDIRVKTAGQLFNTLIKTALDASISDVARAHRLNPAFDRIQIALADLRTYYLEQIRFLENLTKDSVIYPLKKYKFRLVGEFWLAFDEIYTERLGSAFDLWVVWGIVQDCLDAAWQKILESDEATKAKILAKEIFDQELFFGFCEIPKWETLEVSLGRVQKT